MLGLAACNESGSLLVVKLVSIHCYRLKIIRSSMVVDCVDCKVLGMYLVHTVIRYQLSELKKDGTAALTATNKSSILDYPIGIEKLLVEE